MNPYLAVAALFLTVSLMFMLPLVPAIVELRRKSDAQPLKVVQQNAGEIRHFANSFRDYIKEIEPAIQRCFTDGTTATGTLANGEEYVVLGRADEPLLRALEQRDALHPVVITAGVDLTMPADATFSKEIYAGLAIQWWRKKQLPRDPGTKYCSSGRSESGHALGSCCWRIHGRTRLPALRTYFLRLTDTSSHRLHFSAAERSSY